MGNALAESEQLAENVVTAYQQDRTPDHIRRSAKTFSWDRVFEAVSLSARGANYSQIARELDIDRSTVKTYLELYDVMQEQFNKNRPKVGVMLYKTEELLRTVWKVLSDALKDEQVNRRDIAALAQVINTSLQGQARLQGLGGDQPMTGQIEVMTVIVKNNAGEIVQETTIGQKAVKDAVLVPPEQTQEPSENR